MPPLPPLTDRWPFQSGPYFALSWQTTIFLFFLTLFVQVCPSPSRFSPVLFMTPRQPSFLRIQPAGFGFFPPGPPTGLFCLKLSPLCFSTHTPSALDYNFFRQVPPTSLSLTPMQKSVSTRPSKASGPISPGFSFHHYRLRSDVFFLSSLVLNPFLSCALLVLMNPSVLKSAASFNWLPHSLRPPAVPKIPFVPFSKLVQAYPSSHYPSTPLPTPVSPLSGKRGRPCWAP